MVKRHKFKLLGFVSNFMYILYMGSGGGAKSLSLTFREQHRLWVFEIRLLRKTFRPKGHQVTGDWKQNCLLRNFMIPTAYRYLSADRIKNNKTGEACGKYEE